MPAGEDDEPVKEFDADRVHLAAGGDEAWLTPPLRQSRLPPPAVRDSRLGLMFGRWHRHPKGIWRTVFHVLELLPTINQA